MITQKANSRVTAMPAGWTDNKWAGGLLAQAARESEQVASIDKRAGAGC